MRESQERAFIRHAQKRMKIEDDGVFGALSQAAVVRICNERDELTRQIDILRNDVAEMRVRLDAAGLIDGPANPEQFVCNPS